ncbi:MAG: glycosyltransferase [Planctomycetes bacterium]|nr:glycosyltransferase [Planctomycetota bacterium]
MRARVSVVIPVWGTACDLREAVASVRAQGEPDIEILVADDGSGLDIPSALGEEARAVRLLSLSHGGASAARNRAIDQAQGDWIAFLDSDDAWEPGKLARQRAVLESDPGIGMVFTNILVLDADGSASVYGQRVRGIDERLRRGHFDRALAERYRFLGRNCITSTVLARRNVLERAAEGGRFFDESMPVMEDMDLWGRVLERTRTSYLPEPCVRYRRHAGGLHLRHEAYEANVGRLVEKARARNADNAAFQDGIGRFLGDALLRTGLSCLRRSRRDLARSILSRALEANPLEWRAYAGLALSCLPGWGASREAAS